MMVDCWVFIRFVGQLKVLDDFKLVGRIKQEMFSKTMYILLDFY